MENGEEGTTVAVTSKGQATIPKEFREKLHIDTPGRVRFVETDQGDIVVRPVKRPGDLRGALRGADEGDRSEQSATELLRESRERDKAKTDDKHGLSGRSE